MHVEAAEFLRTNTKRLKWKGATVFEVGAYNVNGRARDFVPSGWASWVGFDLLSGPDVDFVGDAIELIPQQGQCNTVVSTEVLEHCPNWEKLLETMCEAIKPGGYLIITCAGPLRAPHSANGGPLMPGEHYRNVSSSEIKEIAEKCGFKTVYAEDKGEDAQFIGKK